jgi:hypothetical protein
MAKTYLTPDELATGNKWLKTVFFPCVKQGATKYIYNSWYESDIVAACKTIYRAIVDRLWDTNGSLEADLQVLAGALYLNIPNDGNPAQKDIYKLKVSELCGIFANICAKKEIFWDDSEYTAHELEYFKKTKFGEALWNFRCFISQEPDKIKMPTQNTSTPKATKAASGSTTTGTGTGAGHTLYRNNAGGIIGTSKDVLNTTYMYCIMGEFNPAGKTKPKIHVSPQGQSAPLKVKYNSGQGHNDCILYFDDLNAANDFKAKCDANLPSNVAFLAVKKTATDPNGYVQVDTVYGQAWIKASKLHEEVIAEEVDLMEEIMAEIKSKPAMSYKEAAEALTELLR